MNIQIFIVSFLATAASIATNHYLNYELPREKWECLVWRLPTIEDPKPKSCTNYQLKYKQSNDEKPNG